MQKTAIILFFMITATTGTYASKLFNGGALDRNFIMLHFMDGEVIRRDDATGACAFMGHCHSPDGSKAVYYGDPLDVKQASQLKTWTIISEDDPKYAGKGLQPVNVFRKSKLNGMSINYWDDYAGISGDYIYDHTLEHFLYLELPQPMQQGMTYTLKLNSDIHSDKQEISLTFDVFNNVSEAIHVNLAGYSTDSGTKAADLYHWMGDGGGRDYSGFEGKRLFLYNTDTGKQEHVGEITFWQHSAKEGEGYNFSETDIWNVDFNGEYPAGTYRLVVEGVGCSPDFAIAHDIYAEPFRVSVLGFFYMRLGQDSPDIDPRPRKPLFIPGVDNTTVYITNLHPYHPAWEDIRIRKTDPWDHPDEFEPYVTGEHNMNAWGGYADAYDWDKRLPHVAIVYDKLLPFILTGGMINNDDTGIAESGNGIPDLLDGVRFEVDAWLRMRDGLGYAHGITNPYHEENRIRYQGGTTAVAGWANALNSAMLAEAFRISGHDDLMKVYLDSALVAFHYTDGLEDRMLDLSEGDGVGLVRGRDFRMMAAAYLYNLTGDTRFEDIMAEESVVTSSSSTIINTDSHNQIYGVAAYLTTPQKVNYPELFNNMKSSVIREAKQMEAGFSGIRPSRRATCNDAGYFWTTQSMQRTMVAHAITDDPDDKEFFLRAMILEADWSLGRNPTNMIQMTTASTPLQHKRSVQFAYTSGYNDGTPGLHPGHTPYWNMNDWAPGMIMGRPTWLASHGYPKMDKWPIAELVFNTDYVWAHTEFTPQQTMRGKMALYAYLYGLSLKKKK